LASALNTMRILQLRKTFRNFQRSREFLHVLLKYGFEDIHDRLKVKSSDRSGRKFLPRRQSKAILHKSRAERVRLALEELGPTFIKLGQMLSTRYDLFSHDYIDELRKLQDNITPFPVSKAREIIETEFGKPVETVFSSFEETPVAAASIAQVHRAVTKDGRSVVLKIQRPGIETVIRHDIDILMDLAHLLLRHVPESEYFDPVGIVGEFGRWISQELDFYQEGRNTDRFKHNFEGDRTVRIPSVYWDLTTPKVLALEYIDGIPVGNMDAVHRPDLNRKILAKNGAKIALKAVFENGFFHGDPHPGNILVLEDNVLVLLDFGLVGRTDDSLTELIGRMLGGILDKDVDRIIRVLQKIGSIRDEVDFPTLKSDLREYVDRYYGVPLYQLKLDKLIREMLNLFSKHRIRLPRDLYLMGKALMEVEGIARSLDPKVNMMTLAEPYIRKAVRRRMNRKRLMKDAGTVLEDYKDFIGTLPDSLRQILIKLRKGELGVNLHHQGLDRLIREMDKSSNRLSFSLIIASIIIASSLIIQINRGPMLFGLSAFGLTGYLFAGLLGLWLVIAILRSGRL
jgi:ubiquinone biosynthesis protein